MDINIYKDILGIEEFNKYFPKASWCYFHDVLEFRWYRDYDYEEWDDRFCIEMKMSDMMGKDVIIMKFIEVSGNCNCDFWGWISGFEIVNLRYADMNYETHFEVLDFEDSHIHFYCDKIEIQIVTVNGIEVK